MIMRFLGLLVFGLFFLGGGGIIYFWDGCVCVCVCVCFVDFLPIKIPEQAQVIKKHVRW